MKNTLLISTLFLFLTGCAVSKSYHPSQKYGPEQLKEDYDVFRSALEESHPSLYWYTSKDSIDGYFDWGRSQLTDSMAEYQFRNVLSYVVSKFRCGHTSIRPSEAAIRFAERTRPMALPLGVKAWKDTVMVTANLNRKDSTVVRGVLLKAIEGRLIQSIVDSMFTHLSGDGYNLTHKYQTLSNGGTFRSLYGALYGLRPSMSIDFVDSTGQIRTANVEMYNPTVDSAAARRRQSSLSRRERRKLMLQGSRQLRMDTATHSAVLELNSFTRNIGLRRFFRKAFKKLKKENIPNLVIDLRGNGGGSVVLSNLLTKYIARKPFKIADSIYALKRGSRYKKYIEDYQQNRLFLLLLAHKKQDGFFHFTMYENKFFKPKKKHHYDGNVFILTGGNTFSAASLFTQTVREQSNVIVVGEETGGGAYGNTAWLIPEVQLPQTKVRFRLPLFRLVVDKHLDRGRGVVPEVEALPTARDIRLGVDFKMEKVRQLIRHRQFLSGQGVP